MLRRQSMPGLLIAPKSLRPMSRIIRRCRCKLKLICLPLTTTDLRLIGERLTLRPESFCTLRWLELGQPPPLQLPLRPVRPPLVPRQVHPPPRPQLQLAPQQHQLLPLPRPPRVHLPPLRLPPRLLRLAPLRQPPPRPRIRRRLHLRPPPRRLVPRQLHPSLIRLKWPMYHCRLLPRKFQWLWM